MIRCIIAGSRDFADFRLLSKEVSLFLQDYDSSQIEIVSGTARGADTLGEVYARNNNLPIKKFPANWEKHGKRAGILRNEQMAKYSTHCIVFVLNNSRGSLNMIDTATKFGLRTRGVHIAN